MDMSNIKRACRVAGLSQRDVARICDVTPPTVSSWFLEKTAMPLDSAIILSKTLGLTLDEMCNGTHYDNDTRKLVAMISLLDDKGKEYLYKQARFALFDQVDGERRDEV